MRPANLALTFFLELGAFALAFAALAGAGHGTAAAVLGALTALNAALPTAFGQWEH